MRKADCKKLPANYVGVRERWSNGACKHCFNTSFQYSAPGIPYDWSLLCGSLLQHLLQSFGSAHAEFYKYVEHVKPSHTAPFDVLTFDILTQEKVF